MSGSPILADDGSAIRVESVSAGARTAVHTEGGPNPRLAYTQSAGKVFATLDAL
jgi:hypothetical protein